LDLLWFSSSSAFPFAFQHSLLQSPPRNWQPFRRAGRSSIPDESQILELFLSVWEQPAGTEQLLSFAPLAAMSAAGIKSGVCLSLVIGFVVCCLGDVGTVAGSGSNRQARSFVQDCTAVDEMSRRPSPLSFLNICLPSPARFSLFPKRAWEIGPSACARREKNPVHHLCISIIEAVVKASSMPPDGCIERCG